MAGQSGLVRANDHVVVVQMVQNSFLVKIVSVDEFGTGIKKIRPKSLVNLLKASRLFFFFFFPLSLSSQPSLGPLEPPLSLCRYVPSFSPSAPPFCYVVTFPLCAPQTPLSLCYGVIGWVKRRVAPLRGPAGRLGRVCLEGGVCVFWVSASVSSWCSTCLFPSSPFTRSFLLGPLGVLHLGGSSRACTEHRIVMYLRVVLLQRSAPPEGVETPFFTVLLAEWIFNHVCNCKYTNPA